MGRTLQPVSDLVGRSGELVEIGKLVEGVLAGTASQVVVSGPAGIGKTALLASAAREAQAAGCRVVWGRCAPEMHARPLWPWLQVAELVEATRGAGGSVAGPGGAGLGVDALEVVIDRYCRWLREAAQDGPLLICLDELGVGDRIGGTALPVSAESEPLGVVQGAAA